MAGMEEALTARLLADAGLAALVGSRMHWMRLPAQVHGRAEATRQARAAGEYAALREAVLKGGQDAPLPDWFADFLDRLYPAP